MKTKTSAVRRKMIKPELRTTNVNIESKGKLFRFGFTSKTETGSISIFVSLPEFVSLFIN
ncbi:MAG: hypothetical protein IPJ75_15280 [Ignavibacteriales bacterium]|nr:hypothetical protein [Ignavibacteriales bacterium]